MQGILKRLIGFFRTDAPTGDTPATDGVPACPVCDGAGCADCNGTGVIPAVVIGPLTQPRAVWPANGDQHGKR